MQQVTTKNNCIEHGIILPDSFWERAESYRELVEKYNLSHGLMSLKELPNFYPRHLIDCLSPLLFLEFKDGISILDYGSGGGFPGVVLALALHKCKFLFVESNQKKSAFLKICKTELKIKNCWVHCDRAEIIKTKYNIVTIRATGPLEISIPRAINLLTEKGKLIVWVGPSSLSTVTTIANTIPYSSCILYDYPPALIPNYNLKLFVISLD